MKAPESKNTTRLLLRKPRMDDAEEIFDRYASDDAVGEFLSWPIHSAIEETREFPNRAPGVLQSAFSFSWLPMHD